MAPASPQEVVAFREKVARTLVGSRSKYRRYLLKRIPRDLQAIIEVDEVLDEVWITVDKELPRLVERPTRDVDRFLMTITRRNLTRLVHRATASKRGRRRLQGVLGAGRVDELLRDALSAERPILDELESRETAEALLTALQKLSASARAAIVMRFFEERPVAEIARRLRRSPAAVHQLLDRALHRLHEAVPQAGFDKLC